eukprot:7515694-Pyramimonas_sp.AAC.1
MLSGDPGQAYVQPPGDPEQVEAAWGDWHQTLDWLRVCFEMPVEGNFETSFEGLLGLREALALPGAFGRLRWLGGDAALDQIG